MINHLNFGEQAGILFLLLFRSLSCMVSHSLPHTPPYIACSFSPQIVCQCFAQLEICVTWYYGGEYQDENCLGCHTVYETCQISKDSYLEDGNSRFF
jgi:hypothetical protein